MNILKKSIGISICFLMMFLITGCDKKKISIEKFNSEMEKRNYTVIDTGAVDEMGITKSSQATDENNKFYFEFYEFDNFEKSKYAYHKVKLDISSLAVKGSTSGVIERKKYLKYVLTNNDYYYVISNIDNTLLVAYTEVDIKRGWLV